MLGPQLLPAGVKALEQALLALRMVEQPYLGERAGRVYGRLDLPVLGRSRTAAQGEIIDVSRAIGLDPQLGDGGIDSLRTQDVVPGDEMLHVIAEDPRSACRPGSRDPGHQSFSPNGRVGDVRSMTSSAIVMSMAVPRR